MYGKKVINNKEVHLTTENTF